VIRFTRFLFREVERGSITLPGFYAEWADPTFKLVRFALIAFAFVAAFPYLPGSQLPAFRGISVMLGLMLSLGSSSVISHLMAGLVLTYLQGFKIGDRVQIGDAVGDVVEKTLLVTRVRTVKNELIAIPNGLVMAKHIINYSQQARNGGLILHTTLTIGYDTPWRQVHALLKEAALATDGVLADPAPFVLQTALNDFHVSYQLNAHTDRPAEMAATYSRLHQNIQDRFNQAGVEIMSPYYAALRDGNASTTQSPGAGAAALKRMGAAEGQSPASSVGAD
jgi:small-conductance mechanosensitive channel